MKICIVSLSIRKSVDDIFAKEIFKDSLIAPLRWTPVGIVFSKPASSGAYKELLNKYDETQLDVEIENFLKENRNPLQKKSKSSL